MARNGANGGPASAGAMRRERERELVAATRALFDERGAQDAPIGEIARAAGLNKALIYRSFASKEELFFATVASYLEELAERAATYAPSDDAEQDLEALLDGYTQFCLDFPAFLDCALSLMRRPAGELRELVSDGLWFRLGQRMGACLRPLGEALARLGVADPDLTANRIYTQVLGTMHLARVRLGIRLGEGGVPVPFEIDPHELRRACVADALRIAGVGAPA